MRENKEISLIGEIGKYIKYRLNFIILFLASTLVYFMLIFLDNGRLDITVYAIEMIGFGVGVYLIIDFKFYFKKRKNLFLLEENVSKDVLELPRGTNILEKQYQEIIEKIYGKFFEFSNEIIDKNHYQTEYYTLWVHQVKTPISALYLILQKMREDGLDTSFLEQELIKVEQYVEMALQFIRIDNISGDLEINEYILENVVKKLVKKYKTIFIYKKIAVKLENLDVKVCTDEKWLMMILEQVLSNALKYTHEGYIKISYKSENAILEVEDTGVGIKKEDINRIFERGFTGYNGRVMEKSTGLGLFLCKKASDKLGYSIAVDSQLGKGTKVSVKFSKKNIDVF